MQHRVPGNTNLIAILQWQKKWIKEAIKKPGALRETLGAKRDKPIAKGKLAKAAKKKGVTGQRARLAQTLRKINKKK